MLCCSLKRSHPSIFPSFLQSMAYYSTLPGDPGKLLDLVPLVAPETSFKSLRQDTWSHEGTDKSNS